MSLQKLDLAAAFDTVDHSSITDLLSTLCGTYMSSHEQKVKLMDCLSSPVEVTWGSSSIRPVAIPQRAMHVELIAQNYTYTLNNIGSLKKKPLAQSPCNPRRTLQGFSWGCMVIVLKVFLLNNLHCLECTGHTEILHHSPSKPFWIASVGLFLISALSSSPDQPTG